MSDKLYLTYNQIQDVVRNLAIKSDEFNADLIIAIGGGGLIPARILQTYQKLPIYTVTLKSYSQGSTESQGNIIVKQWLDNPDIIRNKRVLIVDEIHDTGATIAYCVKKINVSDPEAVAVGVVHWKNREKSIGIHSTIPFYVGRNVPNKWVVYPWEEGGKLVETSDSSGKTDTAGITQLRTEMKQEFENVNKTLRCLTEAIHTLQGSCSRMDGHVDFVEGVYEKLRSPLDFISDNVTRLRGTETTGNLPRIADTE